VAIPPPRAAVRCRETERGPSRGDAAEELANPVGSYQFNGSLCGLPIERIFEIGPILPRFFALRIFLPNIDSRKIFFRGPLETFCDLFYFAFRQVLSEA
jgi:hypothetical protein